MEVLTRRGSLRLGAMWTMAAALPALHAQSDDWPKKPVRIIVPAPAGGAFDRTIRPIAQALGDTLKQSFVVDNRPSAGNIVGTQAGALAPADGYTLTMTGMLNTIAAGLYDKVPFDIVNDFAHIGGIGEAPQWIVVRADAGIASFADLIAKAKAEPEQINYASSGAGSSGHLIMEMLQRATGVRLTHVPYKGGAPALQDVLAGVVSLIALPPTGAMPYVQNGKLKVLAASSARRDPKHPDVPTLAELGFAQLTVNSWVGLSVPKGTPGAIVRELSAALQKALTTPAIARQLETEGLQVLATSPEQYTELVKADVARWGQLIKSLNIKAN